MYARCCTMSSGRSSSTVRPNGQPHSYIYFIRSGTLGSSPTHSLNHHEFNTKTLLTTSRIPRSCRLLLESTAHAVLAGQVHTFTTIDYTLGYSVILSAFFTSSLWNYIGEKHLEVSAYLRGWYSFHISLSLSSPLIQTPRSTSTIIKDTKYNSLSCIAILSKRTPNRCMVRARFDHPASSLSQLRLTPIGDGPFRSSVLRLPLAVVYHAV